MKRIIYILLILCVAVSNAQSQKLQTGSQSQKLRISRSYQNRSLSSVLEDLNAFTGTYDISFVYTDLEDFTVTTSFKGLGLEDALRQVVGLYPIRITNIGYKTVYRLCTQEDMGTVRLQPEAYTLGGVTVKGLRPQFKQTTGGMEVNVDGTLLANMGSAMNVIGELPLVVVKDGKIDVMAKGEPEVYITLEDSARHERTERIEADRHKEHRGHHQSRRTI